MMRPHGENWQSEWLQLYVQAVILEGMKHVLFKADAEDMEQVQQTLPRSSKASGSRRAARSRPVSSGMGGPHRG
jgi:hypothetical protein